jgi:hypothetical protein
MEEKVRPGELPFFEWGARFHNVYLSIDRSTANMPQPLAIPNAGRFLN